MRRYRVGSKLALSPPVRLTVSLRCYIRLKFDLIYSDVFIFVGRAVPEIVGKMVETSKLVEIMTWLLFLLAASVNRLVRSSKLHLYSNIFFFCTKSSKFFSSLSFYLCPCFFSLLHCYCLFILLVQVVELLFLKSAF